MPLAIDAIDSFVRDTSTAFDLARSEAPGESTEWWLRIADHVVHLEIVGRALAERLVPALERRTTHPSARADLTVRCWDRTVTRVGPPQPLWGHDDFLAGGRIRGQNDDRVRVSYDAWMRVLTVYDQATRAGYVHVADADLIPDWVTRAPLRTLLTWWASDRDLATLHASAVADSTGAVVFVGPRGAGKSTTAMACVAAGLRFVGDDSCVVRLDPEAVVFPLYSFAKLEPDALERLPQWRDHVLDPRSAQTVVRPPGQVDGALPLRSILLLRVADHPDTRIVPAATREALRALVSSSLFEGGGESDGALRALARLVERVPWAHLDLGTDLSGVVEAVRGCLAR